MEFQRIDDNKGIILAIGQCLMTLGTGMVYVESADVEWLQAF